MSSTLDLDKVILKCAECGEQFIKVQPTQKFCSDKCRQRSYQKKKKASVEAPKKRDLFAA
jgi:endogenous inhibitor of DNA gyrase (YacG/DUF329 family)